MPNLYKPHLQENIYLSSLSNAPVHMHACMHIQAYIAPYGYVHTRTCVQPKLIKIHYICPKLFPPDMRAKWYTPVSYTHLTLPTIYSV